ncbi:uncharacterized protein LOC129773832 [Toxorhynchites rutilus septentrionalis]|uniref:uncharacterized protein LOC129773832 n=1 Tax=Toxorhynchites rutilus septentrionalis TaxID=329112 RepID=UPI002479A35A|nr:uncharacterized protein LOC129773832 [Toxorhynchites rutilus septentrionalis]
MFHQLRIRGIDRHSLRFLFREDPTVTPDVYVMDVATFGATCSPASAQYVKNRNAADFSDKYPRAVEGIIENHYVDDYLDSFGTVAEAVQISEQVRVIHSKGGFLLRNWQSNSATVKQQLGEITDSSNKHLFHDKTTENGRVLGMLWLTDEDALSFISQLKEEVQQIVENESRPTKRQVLWVLISFFDPLGLLSALMVHCKILLQDIWRTGPQWDEQISEDHEERWRSWTAVLQRILTVKIPRCYFPNATMQCYRQLQLHVFVDASEAAYAAVAYFRIVDTNGTSKCALVTAKTKVAPLKHLSIPRMELQAAVLGTRLIRFILESHTVTITERYMWSDSTTVLAWLRADPRKYKQYVTCRIGEILEQTDVNEWWWVPSKNNPADFATKWGSGPSVDVKGAWFQGPSFLYQPMEGWPKQKVPLPMVEEEFRPCNVHVEAAVPTAVIDCERFSKWERLLRATAYVHRYVGNLKRSIYGEAKNTGFLNQEELQQAEVTLIAMAQRQEFSDELAVLSRDRDRPRTDRVGLSKASSLYQLTPFVDSYYASGGTDRSSRKCMHRDEVPCYSSQATPTDRAYSRSVSPKIPARQFRDRGERDTAAILCVSPTSSRPQDWERM